MFTDSLIDELNAAARPDTWIVNTRTPGVLMKEKDTLGRPLLQPNPSQAGGDMLLDRPVVPTPNVTQGTATLIDSSQVHVGMDVDARHSSSPSVTPSSIRSVCASRRVSICRSSTSRG